MNDKEQINALSFSSVLKTTEDIKFYYKVSKKQFSPNSYCWADFVFTDILILAKIKEQEIGRLRIEVAKSDDFFTIFPDVDTHNLHWKFTSFGRELHSKDKYKKYTSCIKYWVDKPFVKYSEVCDQYRRKGVGTALYILGMNYLDYCYDLPLYSVGSRTKEAEFLWKKLCKLNVASLINEKTYISNQDVCGYSDLCFYALNPY